VVAAVVVNIRDSDAPRSYIPKGNNSSGANHSTKSVNLEIAAQSGGASSSSAVTSNSCALFYIHQLLHSGRQKRIKKEE
jgi:hypothetical protein